MALTSQPLVSVITPVYNTEKYLAECIESVIAQTYKNWEYVIVNNCSTDRSLEIAQHYAQKNARIRIHDNADFLNQMQNWNHAMRQISPASKYCKVVHADDWLFPECIDRMVEVAEANPTVGIVGSYRLDENRVNLDGLPYPSFFIPGREVCRLHLLGHVYLFGSPTSLLIRSDFIISRKDFYNESNIHADYEVCCEVLQNSDFGFIHQVLTYTRRHNETNTIFCKRLNTYILGDLTILTKYGSVYLNDEEYGRVYNKYLTRYYNLLAKNVFRYLKYRDEEFWTFHKNELKKLGISISKLKLFKSSFIYLVNRLLDKLKI
ncbi:MAG: glycosyltransferase family 2 protein [Pseudomonadota bacterium]